ncbi:hypothetical protein Z043-119592 [Arapaima gigas]
MTASCHGGGCCLQAASRRAAPRAVTAPRHSWAADRGARGNRAAEADRTEQNRRGENVAAVALFPHFYVFTCLGASLTHPGETLLCDGRPSERKDQVLLSIIAMAFLDGPRLLDWASSPPHLQFNKYVLRGYRPVSSVHECVRSLFYLHNELGNIYTHGELFHCKPASLSCPLTALRLPAKSNSEDEAVVCN